MTNPNIEWTKVLVHPLGLAGYALFLVFGLVARAKRLDERRWLFPVAVMAAGIVLVGSLTLAYFQIRQETAPVPAAPVSGIGTVNMKQQVITSSPTPLPTSINQPPQKVRQKSTAACSPNITTAGNVTVNCSETSPAKKSLQQGQ